MMYHYTYGLWDTIKFKIKVHAIRYGKNKKKDNVCVRDKIQKEIDRLKNMPNFMNRI